LRRRSDYFSRVNIAFSEDPAILKDTVHPCVTVVVKCSTFRATLLLFFMLIITPKSQVTLSVTMCIGSAASHLHDLLSVPVRFFHHFPVFVSSFFHKWIESETILFSQKAFFC
jgi:hypothetical protein